MDEGTRLSVTGISNLIRYKLYINHLLINFSKDEKSKFFKYAGSGSPYSGRDKLQ